MLTTTPTAADYRAAWATECRSVYPAVDALETQLGCALDRVRLESAALLLACPIKSNPPNWQHGRVIYAVARNYLSERLAEREAMLRQFPEPSKFKPLESWAFLDIGTAKGFSALCLEWARMDARILGRVTSVDVIDPVARVRRNTIAEVDGLKTLAEILAPWPEATQIRFERSTGRLWLTAHPDRVHLAYVDGKHTHDEVSWEAALLAQRQHTGDVIVFDDLQIEGVRKAVSELAGYKVSTLTAIPGKREYAIARKR